VGRSEAKRAREGLLVEELSDEQKILLFKRDGTASPFDDASLSLSWTKWLRWCWRKRRKKRSVCGPWQELFESPPLAKFAEWKAEEGSHRKEAYEGQGRGAGGGEG